MKFPLLVSSVVTVLILCAWPVNATLLQGVFANDVVFYENKVDDGPPSNMLGSPDGNVTEFGYGEAILGFPDNISEMTQFNWPVDVPYGTDVIVVDRGQSSSIPFHLLYWGHNLPAVYYHPATSPEIPASLISYTTVMSPPWDIVSANLIFYELPGWDGNLPGLNLGLDVLDLEPDSVFLVLGVAAEPIPEPSTILLLTTGLASIAGYGKLRRRKRR